MNYLAIFAACIGVPALILSMAYLAWLAAEGDREREDDCDCQWCQHRERENR